LGCRNVSNQESAITVLPAPIAAFDLAELSYNMYNPEVEFVNASRYGVKWWWSFGDGALSEDFAPVHTYQQSGEYPVQQVVWNEWGCADTARRPVSRIAGSTDVTGSGFFQGEQWYLVINPITTLYIPNSFTPNGDGDNDFWFVEGLNEGKKFEITVFNRWGETMFEGDNMNYRWDGLMPNSNKYAPIGTYVYVIRFMTSDDKEREVQGSFSLIR
jgi:gliding motility-associated-like protein